jgi:hypothetical protein
VVARVFRRRFPCFPDRFHVEIYIKRDGFYVKFQRCVSRLIFCRAMSLVEAGALCVWGLYADQVRTLKGRVGFVGDALEFLARAKHSSLNRTGS